MLQPGEITVPHTSCIRSPNFLITMRDKIVFSINNQYACDQTCTDQDMVV